MGLPEFLYQFHISFEHVIYLSDEFATLHKGVQGTSSLGGYHEDNR